VNETTDRSIVGDAEIILKGPSSIQIMAAVAAPSLTAIMGAAVAVGAMVGAAVAVFTGVSSVIVLGLGILWACRKTTGRQRSAGMILADRVWWETFTAHQIEAHPVR
jgi:hypothetical protein